MFKSLIGDWPSPVRRLLWEQEIVGSNPTFPTISCSVSSVVEQDLYTVKAGGSNPSPSTIFKTTYIMINNHSLSDSKINIRKDFMSWHKLISTS